MSDGSTVKRVALLLAVMVSATRPGTAQQQRVSAVTRGQEPYVSVSGATIVLAHVQLVDGTGGPPRQDQSIVIDNERILAVGPSRTTAVPLDARAIDLAGHTVIPGLVGLHEHTYFGGVRRLTQMSESGPLLYLGYGVTTAMTAGSQLPYHELNLARAVRAGDLPGPRFLIAGPYLNADASRNPMSRNVATPAEMRRTIAYWADEGASWVKFMGSVTHELLEAGIAEARSRGLKTTGHLCSITFTEAARLGVDLLQHGFITNSEYVPGRERDRCPPGNMQVQADVDVKSVEVQASIRAIVDAGPAVASTLAVYETFVPGRPLDARALDLLDPETRVEVEATHAGLGQAAFNVPERLLRKMMEWERDFVAAGGVLGAGADPWGTGLLPGIGNLRNFELLVEAGFAPETAVQIVTLNGARVLGRQDEIGSVQEGKIADLVVIQGDVVRAPSSIYNVVTVFKDGVGYDGQKLRSAARGKVGIN